NERALGDGPSVDAVVPNRLGRGALVVALAATAVVVAAWSEPTVAALHHGMGTIDRLWYHVPHAARFVQDGLVTGLHFVDSVAVFYPANSALPHALGITLLGNDLLSRSAARWRPGRMDDLVAKPH